MTYITDYTNRDVVITTNGVILPPGLTKMVISKRDRTIEVNSKLINYTKFKADENMQITFTTSGVSFGYLYIEANEDTITLDDVVVFPIHIIYTDYPQVDYTAQRILG